MNFTKVLDITEMPNDEPEGPGEQVDRAYWDKISNLKAMSVVDQIAGLLDVEQKKIRITYNKGHIALGTTGTNFVWFHPRKTAPHNFMDLKIDAEQRTEYVQKLEDAGLVAGNRRKVMKVRLNPKEISDNKELLKELINYCEEYSRS